MITASASASWILWTTQASAEHSGARFRQDFLGLDDRHEKADLVQWLGIGYGDRGRFGHRELEKADQHDRHKHRGVNEQSGCESGPQQFLSLSCGSFAAQQSA